VAMRAHSRAVPPPAGQRRNAYNGLTMCIMGYYSYCHSISILKKSDLLLHTKFLCSPRYTFRTFSDLLVAFLPRPNHYK
jgi:hypothetical protein